jgi:hypothetical protein
LCSGHASDRTRMKGMETIGQKGFVGEGVEVGRSGKDAAGFVAPVIRIAAFKKFRFEGGKGLQEELEGVGDGDSFAAGNVAADLVDEKFAESEVDGRGGLKITDGGEEIAGDEIAIGDAAQFAKEMVVAAISVTGIDSVGAAFAVGAKELAAAVGGERRRERRGGSGLSTRNGFRRRA